MPPPPRQRLPRRPAGHRRPRASAENVGKVARRSARCHLDRDARPGDHDHGRGGPAPDDPRHLPRRAAPRPGARREARHRRRRRRGRRSRRCSDSASPSPCRCTPRRAYTTCRSTSPSLWLGTTLITRLLRPARCRTRRADPQHRGRDHRGSGLGRGHRGRASCSRSAGGCQVATDRGRRSPDHRRTHRQSTLLAPAAAAIVLVGWAALISAVAARTTLAASCAEPATRTDGRTGRPPAEPRGLRPGRPLVAIRCPKSTRSSRATKGPAPSLCEYATEPSLRSWHYRTVPNAVCATGREWHLPNTPLMRPVSRSSPEAEAQQVQNVDRGTCPRSTGASTGARGFFARPERVEGGQARRTRTLT